MTEARLLKSSRGAVHAVEVCGLRWDVEIDSGFPHRGNVEYHPRRVLQLQEWDSEVFLHECLHIAFAVAPDGTGFGPDFNGNRRISDAEQERLVQHLSHVLDGIGYRVGPASPKTMREALALARSMILSGEKMTPEAEAIFDEALGMAGKRGSQHGG